MEKKTKIEHLVLLLKSRLSSSGKSKATDEFGNTVYIESDIYSVADLESFISLAVSQLKLLFKLADDSFYSVDEDKWDGMIVQGATILALSSKALVERGREFVIADDGISFDPPKVSDILLRQWEVELSDYQEKIRILKTL